MDNNLINHILIYSGVEVTDCPREFDVLYKKLSRFFLTTENEQWFCNRNSGSCPKSKYLFWELFSFGILNADKNDEAVRLFEEMRINKCYLLQQPEYNLCSDSKPAYYLKGKYDVSLIDDDRQASFKSLKHLIGRGVPIPFWVIESISSATGKEFYAFDESLNWVLVLTHENEVYLYKA